MRKAVIISLAVILIFLQLFVLPVFFRGWILPNFIIIFSVYFSLYRPFYWNIILAISAGFFYDVIFDFPSGTTGLCIILCGLAIPLVIKRIKLNTILSVLIAITLATIICEILSFALLRLTGQFINTSAAFKYIGTIIIFNLFFGMLLLPILTDRKTRKQRLIYE
jgi:rod shape-determining protein MreD